MDIAKYIGLFLLKNNFCYLHGFGNLELRKKPASYDGDALNAPEYDVVLTPGGSIDDTLANYIATHEQTSISKASNTLREFSTATRAELAAGKEVEIPGIGTFSEQNGIVRFAANPQLKYAPPPVPMLRMSKRLEDAPDFRRDSQDSHPGGDDRNVAWGRIALLALLVVGLIVVIIWGIRHFSDSSNIADTTDTITTEASAPATSSVPVSAPPIPAADEFDVVVNTYSTRMAADRRADKLSNNGNLVKVISPDSSRHLVTIHIKAPVADTTRMLDSLRRFFNPKGVYILR